MKPSPLALALLPLLCGALSAQSPAPLDPPDPPRAPIAVLGASMSGGFDLVRTYRAQIDLSHIVRASLLGADVEVTSFANVFLFTDPVTLGAQQASKAREMAPGLVLALDFPFWFGYGGGMDEEGRLALLERGLALLEGFDVPVVVGDFPDMRAATQVASAYGFPMLRAGQVPTPQGLERLNARLREWAGAKPSRVLIGLDAFHRALARGERIEVRGNAWQGEDLPRLLLEDQLHPSVEGNIALVLVALDALVRGELGLSEEEVLWDAARVRERLDEATRAERERALELERRREERRRARQEREQEQGAGEPPRRAPGRGALERAAAPAQAQAA